VDEAPFWRLGEDARAEIWHRQRAPGSDVVAPSSNVAPECRQRFQELWEQAQDELYRWPILDAATLLLGHVSRPEKL